MKDCVGGPPGARPVVTRFAPSPTGLLHVGHAFAALTAWHAARAAGGRFLLRVEDIDATRCRPAFVEAILEDLAWLGIAWDGEVRVQSAHLAEYRAVLDALAARDLLYPCFCTRAEIVREVAAAADAPQGPEGPRYPGTCRRLDPATRAARLAAGTPHALRLDMARAVAAVRAPLAACEAGEGRWICDPLAFGDVVLGRKDAPASYHLCATHDDAAQGVTLVTRGADLRPATSVHRLLQALMGWPAPRYAHHPLVMDEFAQRLAKRNNSPSLRSLRQNGIRPGQIRARFGY